jgi:osmoprotectant transport system substrate-binding protein
MRLRISRPTAIAALVVTSAIVLAACSSSGGNSGGGTKGRLSGTSFNVGSKEFTENKILAQITADMLKNAGASVKTTSLTGSSTVRQALVKGDIDMYWEYTGTGWVNILGHTTSNVPANLYQKVAAEDKAQHNVAWLQPAPMNDTYAIATTKQFSSQNHITSMSEMATFVKNNPSQGEVCAASEFINRDDGLPGVEKVYNFHYSGVVQLDLGLIYSQVGKKCSFAEVFSTDGRIVANNLKVLNDDKNFFIKYNAALTMRQATLNKYPAIKDIMAPVSAALTNAEITKLNADVDVDGKTIPNVAKQWLTSKGFLS